MGEHCQKCGGNICGLTVDCPGCGFRVKEDRLERKVAMLEDAILGWKGVVRGLLNETETKG